MASWRISEICKLSESVGVEQLADAVPAFGAGDTCCIDVKPSRELDSR